MLKIRLQRVGRIHEPSFRLVLTDSQNSTKSGRFKEILGSYDPRKSTDAIKADRVKYWLSQGASATGTVHNLLITHKIIEGKKVNVLPKKTYNPEVQPAADNGAGPQLVEESKESVKIEESPQPSPEATAGEAIEETAS